MAKVHASAINPAVRVEGEWIGLTGDTTEGIEIRARGFTDAYTDARNRRMRRAAQGYRNDVTRIPAAMQRQILIECLIEHVLIDVRGAENEDDSPTTFDQFCALLRDQPRFENLYVDVINACTQAGEIRKEQVNAAAGN